MVEEKDAFNSMKTRNAKSHPPSPQERVHEQGTTRRPRQSSMPHGQSPSRNAHRTGSPAAGLQEGGRTKVPELCDVGLSFVLETLKVRRLQRKLSAKRLATMASVPTEVTSRLESHDAASVTIRELLSVAEALNTRLTVFPVHPRPTLPRTNEEILAEFDRLVTKGQFKAFFRKHPDKEHSGLLWDMSIVIGSLS